MKKKCRVYKELPKAQFSKGKTALRVEPLDYNYYVSGHRQPGIQEGDPRFGLGLEHTFSSPGLSRNLFKSATLGLHAGLPYEKQTGTSLHATGQFKAKPKTIPGTPFTIEPMFQGRAGYDPNRGLNASWHGLLKGSFGNYGYRPDWESNLKSGEWRGYVGAGYGNEARNIDQYFTKPSRESEKYVDPEKRFSVTPGILEGGFFWNPTNRDGVSLGVKGGVRGSLIENKGKGIFPYANVSLKSNLDWNNINKAYDSVADKVKDLFTFDTSRRSTPKVFKAGGENNMPFNQLSQGSGSKPEGSSYLQGFIGTMQQNIQNFQTDGPIADSIDILNYASESLPEFKKSGSKKKWIQGAVKQMKNKGTVGAFTQYCGGKVTAECIERGLNSPDKTVQKRARFAKAMRNLQAGGEVFDTYKTGGSKGPCWKNYKMVGMKNKGGRQVPNCVPKKEIGGNLQNYQINGGVPWPTVQTQSTGVSWPTVGQGLSTGYKNSSKPWLFENTVQNPPAFDAQAYNYIINNQGSYDIQGGFQNALKTAMKDWSHNQYYAPKGVPEDAIITGYEPGMGKKTSKLYYFDPANPKQPNTNITAQQNITSHPLQGTPTYDANQAYFPPTIYKFSGSTPKAQNSKDVDDSFGVVMYDPENPKTPMRYMHKGALGVLGVKDGKYYEVKNVTWWPNDTIYYSADEYEQRVKDIISKANRPMKFKGFTLDKKRRGGNISAFNDGYVPKAQASAFLPGQGMYDTNQLLDNPLWNPNWGQNVMNTWRANSDELELEKVDDGRVERAVANFYTPAAYATANFFNRDERQLAKQMLDFNRSTEESTAVSLAERGQHEVNRNPFTPGLMPHRLRGSAGGFEVPIATAQFGLSVGDVGEYSDEDLQALIDAGYEFEYI